MEVEFIALATAERKVEWLRNLLLEIELWPQPLLAISIFCDNEVTMSLAYSKICNGKFRHMGLSYKYIRELIRVGVITITYVKTDNNLADPVD